VYATSTPREVKEERVEGSVESEGVLPTMRWPWRLMPSIFMERALRMETRDWAAVTLTPEYSML
jgi:hypothetical protein